MMLVLLFTGYMLLRMTTPKSTLTTASAARSERHPKRRKRRRIPSTKYPIGHRRRRARHKRIRCPRQRRRRHPWRRGRIEPRRWRGKVPTTAPIWQRITATAAIAAIIIVGIGAEGLRLGLSERRRIRRRESRVSPEDRRRQLHTMLLTWVMTSKVIPQSRVRMERVLSIGRRRQRRRCLRVMLLHHGWPLLLLLLLILRMMQCLYKLLLLLQRRSTIVTPSTRRGTHAQGVLAVRQSNPILHNPAQRVARHFGKSFRRKMYVLKLRKETSIFHDRKKVTEDRIHTSTKHIGPFALCLKQSLR